eukprot:941786-Rhodomonas_salina.1
MFRQNSGSAYGAWLDDAQVPRCHRVSCCAPSSEEPCRVKPRISNTAPYLQYGSVSPIRLRISNTAPINTFRADRSDLSCGACGTELAYAATAVLRWCAHTEVGDGGGAGGERGGDSRERFLHA